MSLEIALQENTSAVRELAALIERMGLAAPTAKAEKAPKAEKAAPAPVAEPVVEKAAEPVAEVAEVAAPVAEATKVTTEDAITLFKQVIAVKGREVGVAILTGMGATRLSEVPEGRLAEFADKAKAALA